MTVENNPAFSHWCKECGRPVGKPRTTKEERGECLAYGNKTLCQVDYAVIRGVYTRSTKPKAKPRVTKPRTTSVMRTSEWQRIKHENNMLGLQHYMERRRERLAKKCQVSK